MNRLCVLVLALLVSGGASAEDISVRDAVLGCYGFLTELDTGWIDELEPEYSRGTKGDERINRLHYMEGQVRGLEAGYLSLDQGELINLITVGSHCGVFVASGNPDLAPAIDALRAQLEATYGAFAPVDPPHESATLDLTVCVEGRNLRLRLTPTEQDDVGKADWLYVEFIPDFGEGCEL